MTLQTSRQSMLGLINMLNSDDSRTWQEVFVSGDVSSRNLKCIGSVVRGTIVSLVFIDPSGLRHYVTISDNIALGYPIASVFSMELGTYWKDDQASDSRVRGQVVALEVSDRESAVRNQQSYEASPRILVRGHANFAHVLLSVCPAIERMIELSAHAGSRLRATVIQERHPLGSPSELYAELGEVADFQAISEDIGGGFRYSGDAIIPVAVGVRNKKPLMVVTEATRTRVRNFVPIGGPAPSGMADRVKAGDHDFILWMSVRMLGRRSIPLIEAIDLGALVAARLEAKFERPAIILDGLSLQFGDTLRSPVSDFDAEHHLDAERLATGLIAAQASKTAPKCTFYAAVGLPLWESIQLAGIADAYIVHDGTTQHKIGWLYPETPGIMHGPRQRNVGQGYAWHPVDAGTPAIYVPPECVVDHKEVGTTIAHANYGYSLVQGDRLEGFIETFLDVIDEDDPNSSLYRLEYES
ncbi:hypothetical protein [Pengzhenrongella sicca]|uniref:Uncharacterized protein n=1 Tax=Pengzhenrongella sicca TaxID=2819238 RepID=A0A8A4ZDD6_9MICO|nr:hypothetical protein [Pengzhenrongella sicca]QTE29039.1 hypothetical protein J4E96_17285 [Pengzhenrongella sicca]